MLAPMQATLEQAGSGWLLRLSPIQAADAVAVWGERGSDGTAMVVVTDIVGGTQEAPETVSLIAAGARRLGIRVVDRYGEGALVMDVRSLRELVGWLQPRRPVC